MRTSTVLTAAFAICLVLPAISGTAQAKTEAECRAAISAHYPRGTLSKKSGTREMLITACIAGKGDSNVPVVRANKRTPRLTDAEWLKACTNNKHSQADCNRWLANGRKGRGG